MQFLPIFLQILSGLFTSGACKQIIPTSAEPNPAPLTPQETLEHYYDTASQKYDSDYVESLRPHARQAERQAAREAGEPRSHGKRELDAKIVEGLEKVRTAPPEKVTAFMSNPTSVSVS